MVQTSSNSYPNFIYKDEISSCESSVESYSNSARSTTEVCEPLQLSSTIAGKDNFIDKIRRQSSILYSKLSFQSKTTIVALALGTIPVAVIGGISYTAASRSLERKIVAEQQSLTVDLAREVEVFTQKIATELRYIASSPLFTDPQLRTTTSQSKKIELLDNTVNQGKQKYKSLAVFDLQGNLLLKSEKNLLTKSIEDGNVNNREYFQRAIATKNIAIGNPTLDPQSGEMSLGFALPITEEKTDKLLGVVHARISMEHYAAIFKVINAQGFESKIIDSEGKILWADEKELLGMAANAEFEELPQMQEKMIDRDIKIDREVPLSGIVLSANILDKEAVKENEKIVLASLTFIPEREGILEPGWSIIISRTKAEAFAPVSKLGWMLFLGTSAAALASGAIATILTKRFIRPILNAADAIACIGKGELNTRLPVNGEDEVAKLCANINHMAGQLETSIAAQTRSARISHLLATISGTFIDENEAQLKTVFAQALSGARELLQIDRMAIYSIQKDNSTLISYASATAAKDETDALALRTALLTSHLGLKAIDDLSRTEYEQLQLWEKIPVKALLTVPIQSQGQPYALLVAHHDRSPHSWQEEEIQLLQNLAAQFGVILDRLALVSQKAREAEHSRVLKDIALKFSYLPDFQSICDTAAGAIVEVLKAERAIVYQFNENNRSKVIAESSVSPWRKTAGANLADLILFETYLHQYQQRGFITIEDLKECKLGQCYRQQLAEFSIRSCAIFPILVNGKLFGLSIAHQCSGPRHWSQAEIDLLTQIVTQAGQALERALLVEEQRITSVKLQKSALKLLAEIDPVNQGDLRVRAKVTPDEIGTVADFYNATIESLREIVISVQNASRDVSMNVSTSESAVQDLLQGVLYQSGEIALAKERIEGMAKSIAAVSTRANQARSTVRIADGAVASTEAAMNRTVNEMQKIRETVAVTSKKVKRLSEFSQKISKVVSTIEGFAEQTSLLALNASIEAVQGGERGVGLSVVAREVHSLARKSALAAVEIEEIVANIQSQTKEVLRAMEAATERVVNGTISVAMTRNTLNSIAEASATIQQMVEAIAIAAAKQSEQESSVSQNMTEVAAISLHTTNEASILSAAFLELLEVAQTLQDNVDRFKVQ